VNRIQSAQDVVAWTLGEEIAVVLVGPACKPVWRSRFHRRRRHGEERPNGEHEPCGRYRHDAGAVAVLIASGTALATREDAHTVLARA